MKRNSSWSQESPIVQLRVILGSIEGDIMNISDGIASGKVAARALKHVRDAKQLAEAIAKGDSEWDPE